MKNIDLERSYSIIGTKNKENNLWRQKICSKLEIYSLKDELIDVAYSNYPCLSESLYEKPYLFPLWTHSNIITKKKIITIRLSSIYFKKHQIFDRDSDPYKTINIKENISEYREASLDEIINPSENIYCLTQYQTKKNKYKLFFEVKYLNFDPVGKRYQPDAGPILYSESEQITNINDVTLAYCAFSSDHKSIEFNVLSETTRPLNKFLANFEFLRRKFRFYYWNTKKELTAENKLFIKTEGR